MRSKKSISNNKKSIKESPNENFNFEDLSKIEKGAIEDLRDLKEAFEANGLKFWLMSGTLLGCMTRDRILPGDRDIDFGAFGVERDKFTSAIPGLKEKGFLIKERYDPVNKEIKGMVTLKRNAMPVDIKFYKEKDGYAVRAIHKSHGLYATLVWELVDILHFKKLMTFSLFSRFKVSFLGVLLAEMTNFISDARAENLKKQLSEKWMKGKSRYGMVVIPLHYFKSFRNVNFYGMEFSIPANVEEYLEEEYGKNWNQDDPKRKGGWAKKSHLVYDKNLIEEVENDEELMNRCRVIGYI